MSIPPSPKELNPSMLYRVMLKVDTIILLSVFVDSFDRSPSPQYLPAGPLSSEAVMRSALSPVSLLPAYNFNLNSRYL